ncbi:DUF2911 domain-containing protein [soil metagenome]
MTRFGLVFAGSIFTLIACGPAPAPAPDTGRPGAGSESAAMATCQPSQQMAVEGRASPYDSTVVDLGGAQAKICYGRPSARDRVVFGQLVPYDRIWRTGANEPTIIHLPVSARIGTLDVAPGSYSIYTVPGRQEWTVIVNRSTDQWGHESQYTAQVQAQEVGRFRVPAEATEQHVETFAIRPEPPQNTRQLVLEWENTRVRIPIARR